MAREIKAGSTVTRSDAAGLRAFRDSLKKSQHLVRGVVLHADQARPLDADLLAGSGHPAVVFAGSTI